MPGVVLSSFVLIALGVVVMLVGVIGRRRGEPYGRYLIVVGGVLVLVGLAGLGYFMRAFG
ncbi:MAG: hypothetical protein ACLFNI_00810 [Natronomonas sp.]